MTATGYGSDVVRAGYSVSGSVDTGEGNNVVRSGYKVDGEIVSEGGTVAVAVGGFSDQKGDLPPLSAPVRERYADAFGDRGETRYRLRRANIPV